MELITSLGMLSLTAMTGMFFLSSTRNKKGIVPPAILGSIGMVISAFMGYYAYACAFVALLAAVVYQARVHDCAVRNYASS